MGVQEVCVSDKKESPSTQQQDDQEIPSRFSNDKVLVRFSAPFGNPE
jgi:hypothetical protein